ncbi:hypothetical protein [Xanthobacter sediminis]
MSLLKDAVTQAVQSAAARPDVPLDPSAVDAVVTAVTQALPAPAGMEPLWPQLMRYAISGLGAAIGGIGVVSADTAPIIAGAIIYSVPPVYRIIRTWIARRQASA